MSDMPQPPGVAPDRALVERIDDATAVLRVGPGGTQVNLEAQDLPPEAAEGTWVVLDLQLHPPLVLGVDEDLTRERS
jgi:hypothetical protein